MRKLTFIMLLFFVFTIPWQSIILFEGLGTFTRLLGLMVAGLAILNVFTLKHIKEMPLLLWLMIAFVVWSLLSYFWSVSEASTIARFITNIQLLAMVWLIWQLCGTKNEKTAVLYAYILGAYVSVSYLIYIYLTAQYGGFRLSLENIDPNDLATTIALGIPLSWYLLFYSKRLLGQIILFLYAPLALFSVILTASRGGLLVTLVALSVIPLIYISLDNNKKIITAVGALIGLIFLSFNSGALFANLERNIERLQATPDMIREGDYNYRHIIWSTGLQVFREHPVIGVGAAGFRHAVEEHLHRRWAPHNAYLSVLVDTGIIGFLLFLSCFAIAAFPLLKFSYPARMAYLILIVTLLVGMIPLGWEYQKVTWLVLSFFLLQGAFVVRDGQLIYIKN